MSADPYGRDHEDLRTQVLAEEPCCAGYPEGVHENVCVPATELDHKVPLSRGGRTTRANAQGLCRNCNARKGRDERRRTWRAR